MKESGEVEAEEPVIISNNLDYPAVIKSVVKEGSWVRVGDEIICFDCRENANQIDHQKLEVATGESEYTQAQQSLVLAECEGLTLIRNAENELIDARKDLEKFLKHEKPRSIGVAEQNLLVKEREFEMAREKLDFQRRVNNDSELAGAFSSAEVKSKELEVDRLRLAFEESKSDKERLINFDIPKDHRKFELAVTNKEQELEKVKVEIETKNNNARTNLATLDDKREMKRRRMEYLLGEAGKLSVVAKRDGLIVYDSGSRWGPSVKVLVGETIASHQQLMIIPDMNCLQVKTKVYESSIEQIVVGLPVNINIDVWPAKTFRGRVVKVAAVPDSGDWFSTQKAYPVEIAFDELPGDLRPGMTAQVELFLNHLEGVLNVPVATVFSEKGENYCWVLRKGKPIKTLVQIGKMNTNRVEILSGLEEGDDVLLSEPEGQVG